MKIVPKNWQEFQHYKDREPPWIKLHHRLLDNFEFQGLPVASRALAPMLWLIASEHKDGVIDATPENLAFRLRTTKEEIEGALSPLIGKGFFDVTQFASKPLAVSKRVAMPEERREETETEAETISAGVKYGDPFTKFWSAWPKSKRKMGKFKCWEVWRSKKLDSLAEEIITHVEVMRTSEQWRDGFDPAPLTYLNGRRWDDGAPETETKLVI